MIMGNQMSLLNASDILFCSGKEVINTVFKHMKAEGKDLN